MSVFGPIVDQVRETFQSSARTGPIIRVIWHHQASTNDDATIQMMVSGSRQVSSTYTVNHDDPGGRGWSRITGVVSEDRRPWTTDSAMLDGQALTIEVANLTGDPDWAIAPASLEACARIAAYAYTQYGVPLRRITSAADPSGHLRHDEAVPIFGQGYSTFCPGHLDIDAILARARGLVAGEGDDMPLNDQDKAWIQATVLDALNGQAVSGAADVGLMWDVNGQKSRTVGAVTDALRSEGVSGAGDTALQLQNTVDLIRAKIDGGAGPPKAMTGDRVGVIVALVLVGLVVVGLIDAAAVAYLIDR